MQLDRLLSALLALAALAGSADAGGRRPGSVLVYPFQSSNPGHYTILSVTNTNTNAASPWAQGGTTNVQFDYVNVAPGGYGAPPSCSVFDRGETLTPGDTLSVLTACHNLPGGHEGYLVVSAQSPAHFKEPWSWNHLVGSELVVSAVGGVYSTNALPFSSPLDETELTDLDADGQLDFDGLELEGVPDELVMDSFVGSAESSLSLINLSGGTQFDAYVQLDVWNDNEFPLSATYAFRCWSATPLHEVSAVFSEDYLRYNTPNDPEELDADCDGVGDHESGWARLRGLSAFSLAGSVPDPAIVGAVTGSLTRRVTGGRLLWETGGRQTNGAFLGYGTQP